MSSRYIYSTLDINLSVFRYWQAKPREVLEMLYRDTALGNYLVEGFTREALKPGFDIVDKEGVEIHEDLDLKLIEDLLNIYIKAKAAKKAYSFAVLIYYKFEHSKDKRFYWIEDTHITSMEVEPGTNNLLSFAFTPPIEDSLTSVLDPVTVSSGAIKDLRLLAEPTEIMGKYRSWYEPIFDELIGITGMYQQLALLLSRLGSGLRYIKAPASALANSETRTKYENMLENMGMNTLFAYPDGQAEGFEFGVKFGDGTPPMSFAEALDNFLVAVSIYSKLPKEALKGNEIGLRSAETNRQAFLNTLTEEQTDSINDIMWMISKQFDIEFAEGDTLRWKPLVEVDETERVTVTGQKLKIVQELEPSLDILGMDIQELYDLIGLELSIDEAKRQEAITQKEVLREKIQEGMSEGSESESDDDEPDGLQSEPIEQED